MIRMYELIHCLQVSSVTDDVWRAFELVSFPLVCTSWKSKALLDPLDYLGSHRGRNV